MSTNCDHNCESCGNDCSDRSKGIQKEKLMDGSSVKKVICVVSGKGGVGKSLITSLLAVLMRRKGANTAILDADITGPSIPKAFGLKDRAFADETGIIPIRSKTGIDVLSINFLLENDTDPVIWRGPVISGVIRQFWSQTHWNEIEYMFVDMPPGTGDVPLTVFQSLPVDGIIVVSSPQELVGMIVSKAIHMAEMMNVPVLGLVENLSYYECDHCGTKHKIFGESQIDAVAKEFGIDTVAKLPINPAFAALCDKGDIESFEAKGLERIVDKIERL